jgi:restriction endonuclease Mrr
VDGVINEDRLGLDRVYLQANRRLSRLVNTPPSPASCPVGP